MADRTDELEKAKQEVHQIIEKMGNEVPPKAVPMIEETIAKMKVGTVLPKDALGFPPEVMELIYQQGYNMFQNGKYKDALIVFNILRDLDLTDTRYTFAIAASYHYQKDYLDAAANYLIMKYLDPLNPVPCFHLYDCYRKANFIPSALMEIQEALVLAEKNPKHKPLQNKIEVEFESFKEFLKEYYKERS